MIRHISPLEIALACMNDFSQRTTPYDGVLSIPGIQREDEEYMRCNIDWNFLLRTFEEQGMRSYSVTYNPKTKEVTPLSTQEHTSFYDDNTDDGLIRIGREYCISIPYHSSMNEDLLPIVQATGMVPHYRQIEGKGSYLQKQ